ncbi:m7G(5')pppN diphosphatase [Schizosaccharomyces cryophilus OY26]|uniref:m7GpppX diphosphatase n=1 Tax=Schizosaccharomyces cryophilus (strain OY26 / ATCC MYA-4695 / CBS 11777 / NBRC 106824 / NRRL Y48691) TaxID=653667 RepID=S9W5E9_SCHCR|nr:m7G(5')pppN diphosphatase [Schizosaccharomyces cryophilus OY26]EPY53799.1 m7G(5')pppN diphosphatase [Schizosaccharomyces cryophilus OY26]
MPSLLFKQFLYQEALEQLITKMSEATSVEKVRLLQNFQFEKVLKEDTKNKIVTLYGYIENKVALLLLEKTAFDLHCIKLQEIPDYIQETRLVQNNDVFHWYLSTFLQNNDSLPSVKSTLIWPAAENHIRKYSDQKRRMIRETPEMYLRIVKPFVETQRGPQIQWVNNILNHKAEAERIVLEDLDKVNGFLVLPDLKWDRQTMSALNLMAIVHRNDLASIRDLNLEHLPLLENIRSRVLNDVPKKFPVDRNQLKLFVHYPPSYYHLHVHIMHVDHETGEGSSVGRAILLDDVIERLQNCKHGFVEKTLIYGIGEQHFLFNDLTSESE